MVAGHSFIAASSFFALALSAPIGLKAARSLVARTAYQVFSGDGTTTQGWPAEASWLSFEDLWTANLPVISASCAQFGVAENSQDEIAAIKSGLTSVASESGVSSSYLLAIMMQESKGCVRAPTTNYGVRNPGLFQDYNGAASCNDGTVVNPCPDSTIKQMISEGAGIGMEVGLSIGIADAGATDVSKYYKAARIYNSGSVPSTGNLGQGVATHCYCSDIANRLIGWTTETSTCDENTIGSLNGGAPSSTTPVESSTPSTPVSSSAPSATESPSAPTATAVAAEPTTAPEASEPVPTSTTDAPATSEKYPSASTNCKTYYDVKAGDNCQSTGVDMPTLQKLNPGLDSNCSNLWLGYSYCVAA